MKRAMGKRIQVWMLQDLYQKVRAKAERESVNVSALLRGWLQNWVEKGERDGRTD